MKTTHIYLLKDPITNQVRYIGKANRPKKRFLRHLRENSKSHKCNWIKSLRNNDSEPILEIVDTVPRDEWEFWESYYIGLFRTWGFNLTNIGEGGLGGPGFKGKSHSLETKEMIRSKMKGRKNPSSSQPGFKNGRCKLTVDDVREIRRLSVEEELSQRKIGEVYKMSHQAIGKIIRYERFPEV